MITLEEWAEVRRLHGTKGVPIKEIVRRLGLARNTVRAALRADAPPSRERGPRGSLVDAVETQVRALLAEFPRMPATVIAERIGWTHSLTILKDRVRELRPLFLPPDPTDRMEYAPGELAQCDLWFPPVPIPVGASGRPGGQLVLPVLAMTCGYSRVTDAVMIPSRKAGDILAGMWEIIGGWGRCPRALVWDREAAIGGTGRPSIEAAAFAGTLGVRIKLTPPRDPEFKGLVERRNGYFNTQIQAWLTGTANARHLRSIGTSGAYSIRCEFETVCCAILKVELVRGPTAKPVLAWADDAVRSARRVRRGPSSNAILAVLDCARQRPQTERAGDRNDRHLENPHTARGPVSPPLVRRGSFRRALP